MHTNINLRVDPARKSIFKQPVGIWIGGLAVRTLFLLLLTVLTARVASPQIENIWSVTETPGDLIRVMLGFAVCTWFVVNVFILPKDADAYRTWLYLGCAAVPFAMICLTYIW